MVQFSPEEKAEVSFLIPFGGIFMRACSSSNGLLTLGVPYPRWLRSGEYPIASLDWEGRYRW